MATSTNEFYIYVSHYKAKTTSADLAARAGEATIIRNDEATNLPVDAHVLYVGDYNISTSGELSYQIILSNRAPNGVQQGERFGGRLLRQMPIIVAVGVNLGVVPLLFVQLAYAKVFYPATILMARSSGWRSSEC